MKKLFTISAAVVMASSAISTAQTLSDAFEGRFDAAPKFVTEALKNGNLPMREIVPVQLDKKASGAIMYDRADKIAAAGKPAATAAGENPFYLVTEGTYYISTIIGPGKFSTYFNTMLYSQGYSATFKPVVGKLWTSTSANRTDLSDYVNADGNLCLDDWGIGGYYGPAISNDDEGPRYYAGAYSEDKKNDYVLLFCATETEPLSFGIYNVQENGVYSGYTDTYAYGTMSMSLDDAGERIATSHTTRVDFGKPKGGSLLIEQVEFVGVSKSGEPLKDDATLDVQLVTFDEMGNVKEVHSGLITANDIAPISGTAYYVSASFFKDEDGFQSAYTPVINDDFSLFISGFDDPNVDLGIFMVYDEGESNTTGEKLGYVHNSYFLMDMGDGEHFYRWNTADALVNLSGYYIGLGEYTTGNKVINGVVGLEGGNVNTVLPWNGNSIDAYVVESTFSVEEMGIYEMPDWVKIGFDSTSFTEKGYTFFIVEAEALTDGSAGRQGDIVLGMKDVEVSMTLHVIQGTDEYISGSGIDKVNVSGAVCNAVVAGDDIVVSCPADVKSINLYNAAGALVSTVAVENGKAVIKNAPAGLNLVNFNGKQSVKVVK